MNLPVGATIGVGVSDNDSDTVHFVADLNRAGYKVATIAPPPRRVVFPGGS